MTIRAQLSLFTKPATCLVPSRARFALRVVVAPENDREALFGELVDNCQTLEGGPVGTLRRENVHNKRTSRPVGT